MRNWPAARLSGAGMIRRTILILVSVTVGLIGSAALASPANALPELYKEAYYGAPYVWAAYNYDYSASPGNTFTDGSALNDQVSSIDNYSDYHTCFYVNSEYRGTRIRFEPYESIAVLSSTYNEKLSSHFTGPQC